MIMAGEGEPAIPVDRHMARRVRAGGDAAAQRQGARRVFVIANDVAPEFRLGDRPQQTLPIAADQEGRIEFSQGLPELDDAGVGVDRGPGNPGAVRVGCAGPGRGDAVRADIEGNFRHGEGHVASPLVSRSASARSAADIGSEIGWRRTSDR